MKSAFYIFIILIASFSLYSQQSTTGKERPATVSKGVVNKESRSQVVLDDIPVYLWWRGCGPTALGMVIGYYDNIGYSNLLGGSAFVQNDTINNAIADSMHYEDYSKPLDFYPNVFTDKSEFGGAHSSDCMADFMHTSWSSDGNSFGWSWSNRIDNAFKDYIWMNDSDYYLNTSYEYFSFFSWIEYKNEIDNNRPVILLVDSDGDAYTDHFVIAFGYDDADHTYAIYDSWDTDIHWYEWREMSDEYSWGIFGFNILEINFSVSVTSNNTSYGDVSGSGNYNIGELAEVQAIAQSGYDFVNWTEDGIPISTDANFSFVVNENRSFVANFEDPNTVFSSNQMRDIRLYPIPTRGKIIIKTNTFARQGISIYNMMGQKIDQRYPTEISQGTMQLDLKGIHPGVYYLLWRTQKSKLFSERIIIEEP